MNQEVRSTRSDEGHEKQDESKRMACGRNSPGSNSCSKAADELAVGICITFYRCPVVQCLLHSW